MTSPPQDTLERLFSVEGKRIAIIGATGLLGTRYVDMFCSLGARVVIGDVDRSHCAVIASEMNRKYGASPLPLFVNNTSVEALGAFFDDIEREFGGLDVLINNGQVKPEGFYAPFESYTKETLMTVLDGNLAGVVIASQKACRLFERQGGGCIVNVSSLYGVVAPDQRIYEGVKNPYFPGERLSSPVSYAVSKAGVVQFTKYLASYLRGRNIRVNCLTPGGVFDGHDEAFTGNYAYRTLLGRMADRDEYCGAMLYLVSDASSYVTGANLIVDGGWTAV